jgi:arabinogalactan oligomer / maltooligosaccharide transport system permease protein
MPERAVDSPPSPPPYRRRFLYGLAAATLFAVGVAAALLAGARLGEAQARAERTAVVTLSALTNLVERTVGSATPAATAPAPPIPDTASGAGMSIEQELAAAAAGAGGAAAGPAGDDALRRRVARFAAAHPGVKVIRVVDLANRQLLASTDPADRGDQAAPRPLRLPEKPLFDLGNRLRAAVSGNRGLDSGVRAPELAVEPLPEGGLRLAAPIERAGEVFGLVEMETAPEKERAAVDWGPLLLALLAPILLFAAIGAIALPLRENRALLAAAAALLLLAALVGYGSFALHSLFGESRATAQAVAERITFERQQAEKLLPSETAGGALPLQPTAWDVDLLRRSRGLVDAAGKIDLAKLDREKRADAGRVHGAGLYLALFALLLLAFVGFGGAATLGANLVRYRVAYAYTLPAMLGMLLLVFFPFFYGIALSFTNANIYNTNKPITELWVALQNFRDVLGDFSVVHRTAEGLVFDYQNFYWTLGFTIVWTITNVACGVTVGLLLALILNTKGLALRPIYRVILILPWAMPNYITALIWKGMFHPQFGVINQVLQLFGGHAVFWFSKPLTSFAAVLATNGWLSFPFMMVVSLGALQSIPADLYEAAVVDGATRWQQFKSITLPSLKPALVPAVILSVIWTFNMFNIIYLVSAGEPEGATEILITKAYKLAFEQYRYGYAAAYSTVIFLILLAYGTWQNRVTGASEGIA